MLLKEVEVDVDALGGVDDGVVVDLVGGVEGGDLPAGVGGIGGREPAVGLIGGALGDGGGGEDDHGAQRVGERHAHYGGECPGCPSERSPHRAILARERRMASERLFVGAPWGPDRCEHIGAAVGSVGGLGGLHPLAAWRGPSPPAPLPRRWERGVMRWPERRGKLGSGTVVGGGWLSPAALQMGKRPPGRCARSWGLPGVGPHPRPLSHRGGRGESCAGRSAGGRLDGGPLSPVGGCHPRPCKWASDRRVGALGRGGLSGVGPSPPALSHRGGRGESCARARRKSS